MTFVNYYRRSLCIIGSPNCIIAKVPACRNITLPGASICGLHYCADILWSVCLVRHCTETSTRPYRLCSGHTREYLGQDTDPQRRYHLRAWLRLRPNAMLQIQEKTDIWMLDLYSKECNDCAGKGERWCTEIRHSFEFYRSCSRFAEGCDAANPQHYICQLCRGAGRVPLRTLPIRVTRHTNGTFSESMEARPESMGTEHLKLALEAFVKESRQLYPRLWKLDHNKV